MAMHAVPSGCLARRVHRPHVGPSAALRCAPVAAALLRHRGSIREGLRHLLQRLLRLRLLLPTWPPSPDVLRRQGGLSAAVALLVVAAGVVLSGGLWHDEDEETKVWLAKACEQRRKKLVDLVGSVPVEKLCRKVSGLRDFVDVPAGAQEVSQQNSTEGQNGNDAEEEESRVKSDTLADAAEEMLKVGRWTEEVQKGFAIAAALLENQLRAAIAKTQREEDTPKSVVSATREADLEALRRQMQAAEELSESLSLKCPSRSMAKRIIALYASQLRQASAALRAYRLSQSRAVLRLLWQFRKTLPFIFLSSACSVLLGAFSQMRLHYQAALINAVTEAVSGSSPTARSSKVSETIGAMAVSEMIVQLADFTRSRLAWRGKRRVVHGLKVALFEALLSQDLDYLEQCDLWQLRSLVGNCGSSLGQVLEFPAQALESSVRMLTSLAMLWNKSSRLASFLGVLLPLRLVLQHAVEAFGDRLQETSTLPDMRGYVNACWTAISRPESLRTMRTFSREPVEVATFGKYLATQDRYNDRGQLIYRMLEPLRMLLVHGTEILALWYGGNLALRGELAVGDMSSFVLQAQGAFDGIRYVRAAALMVSSQALGPLAQMAALLTQKPRIGLLSPPFDSMPQLGDIEWSICFEHVYFAYPQRPGVVVLKDLCFEATAGNFLGVLGTTGAGKSTIFALMLRLYDPIEGRILLNGKDLREFNPLWLRRNIGIVSQDLVLCHRTVRENLVYGCVENSTTGWTVMEPTDAEAKEALRIAQCEETFFDTEKFPSGWHTDVGDGGSRLSAGQKQRLAIARALLKKPQLLLLDEATSALDERSQACLQDALEELRRHHQVTVICIAHRLSNLAKADRLVVLQHGCVAEEGTPTELMAIPNGVFAGFAKTHREAFSADVEGKPEDT